MTDNSNENQTQNPATDDDDDRPMTPPEMVDAVCKALDLLELERDTVFADKIAKEIITHCMKYDIKPWGAAQLTALIAGGVLAFIQDNIHGMHKRTGSEPMTPEVAEDMLKEFVAMTEMSNAYASMCIVVGRFSEQLKVVSSASGKPN